MYWSWWGMTWFWWLFWVIALLGFSVFLVAVPRGRVRDLDDPLRILARRYANGELSDEEYERRREKLARHLAAQTPSSAPPPVDTTTPQPT